jgi:ABC-type hemin transport system substrate-binding protein
MRINKQWAASLLCACMALVGCDRSEPQSSGEPDAHAMRIVTLAPALTKMVIDLGLTDAIVGVGEHDACAPQGAAVVGNFMNVNTERLYELRPTHVLMMTGQHGVPESLAAMAQSAGFDLVAYAYPNGIEDVGAVLFDEAELLREDSGVRDPDRRSVGAALDMKMQAQRLKLHMFMQLAAIGRVTGSVAKPSVLLVIGVEPNVRASAPAQTGTVLDDLLGFAGGLNAAAQSQVSAPVYDREKLMGLAPEVILLLLPNDPPLTENDSRLAAFAGLDIPAVRDGRIALINDPMVLLPATNLPQAAATLAKAIHPDLAARIDAAMDAP